MWFAFNTPYDETKYLIKSSWFDEQKKVIGLEGVRHDNKYLDALGKR